MIRIIHTADLHLGKTLHERDISEDQAHMLEGLSGAVTKRGAEVLVIAGDIYDRSIPPPDAVRLFDTFLMDLYRRSPGTTVILIPGNHDSAARLSFGAGLLARSGLHIRTSAEDCDHPISVTKEKETALFWALPFLTPGSFRYPEAGKRAEEGKGAEGGEEAGGDSPGEGAAPRSQSELMLEALSRIRKVMDPAMTNILVAHCFVAGAASSDSERSFVGMAEQVDLGLFSGFDYVALGHLHRPQTPGGSGRIRYPGSPLAYSFGESGQEKGFAYIELSGKRLNVDFIPFSPLHRMRKIRGSSVELAGDGGQSGLAGPSKAAEAGFLPGLAPPSPAGSRGLDSVESLDYIEAVLTDPEPVLNPRDLLRQRYPNLLSVRQEAFEAGNESPRGERAIDENPAPGCAEAALDPVRAVLADFMEFYTEMRGAKPAEPVAELFRELVGEAERAAV